MKLILKDGTEFEGKSFGANVSVAGEVVFATGMVGYPEALTDPSFRGQILVLTYPLIGNYGVPKKDFWESSHIQVRGLIVCNYIDTPSHCAMQSTLAEWFKKENVPLVEIKDTRALTQKLRNEGVSLGKLLCGGKNIPFENPNSKNLVAEVSTKRILIFGQGAKTIALLDCGLKQNIIRRLTVRGLKVVVVPWDTDILQLPFNFSAVVISNGPGDPEKVKTTIKNVKKIIAKKIPAEDIDENTIKESLWTSDVDLVIRTGKEQRISNFLIWQTAYSELYFSSKYWPDFNEKDLDEALTEYASRQRTFGK